MNHNFNVKLAEVYGVEEAIMINNFVFWQIKNAANKKHYYDGRYWTYNSIRAFSELFPYWSEKQIRRILKSLESKKCVKSGNFNKLGCDRTKWYSVEPLILDICLNGQMELPKRANAIDQMGEPIPDNKPNNKQQIYNIVFDYYNSKGIVKHKALTGDMKKAIDLAKKELNLDEEYFKRIIDRHKDKVIKTSGSQYPIKKRTLAELFGQRKHKSVSLICADYLDDLYQGEKTSTDLKTNSIEREESMFE